MDGLVAHLGVETYAIGVGELCDEGASVTNTGIIGQDTNKNICQGKIKQGELNQLAGSSARVFNPKSYTELGTYAAELEAKLCGECPTAEIPTDVDIEVSGGTRLCYEPVCPDGVRPREVIINVEGANILHHSISVVFSVVCWPLGNNWSVLTCLQTRV